MIMIEIGKQYRFEAAHHLPEHDGKCARPHGHSYVVEVVVSAGAVQTSGAKRGMILDYGDLDSIVKPIIDGLDHRDLNDLIDPTTAEGIAAYIYGIVTTALDTHDYENVDAYRPLHPYLRRVRVSETAKTWAEFRRMDVNWP